MSVAATNRQDNIASFSQYGPLTVDVAAPGLQIVTTANNSSYATNPGVTGTSFASPYAAGVAALIRSEFPTATFGEVKARLIEGAEVAANVNQRTAAGRINAANSLNFSSPRQRWSSVPWTGWMTTRRSTRAKACRWISRSRICGWTQRTSVEHSSPAMASP